MAELSEDEELKQLLDDDDLRDYFNGRDPNRKKSDPFISEETANRHRGKSTVLTTKDVPEEKQETHGISFTQHVKSIKETARQYMWIGISVGLFLAIIITLIL